MVHIIVVGCGGTGGHLISGMGEFLKSFRGTEGWDLILCDGDIVEEHNLENQAFVASDVGRNKALVMCEGLTEAFGIDINRIKCFGYVDSPNDFTALVNNGTHMSNEICLLVGCVDNHRARQHMHKFFYSQRNIVYVDSGNEFDTGQVVTGFRHHGVDYLPPRGYYFPDVITDKSPIDRELSCGAVNVHHPQHIATNKKAANILLSFISWFFSEGNAKLSYDADGRNEILSFCENCGMTTFRTFPPKDAYERFVPFEEKCPTKEEVMGSEEYAY